MKIDRGMFRLSCALVLWAACSSDEANEGKQENPTEANAGGAAQAGARAGAGKSGAGGAAGNSGIASGTAGHAGSAGTEPAREEGGEGGKGGAGGKAATDTAAGKGGSGGDAAPPAAKAGSGGGGAGSSKPAAGTGGSGGHGGSGGAAGGDEEEAGASGSDEEEAGAGGAAGSGVDIPSQTPIGLLFTDAQAEALCAMARGNFDSGDLLTIHSGMCAEMAYAAGNTDEASCRMAQAMCVSRLQEMHGVGGSTCTLDDLPDCRELSAEQFVNCEQARLRAQNSYYITLTCASDFDAQPAFQTPPACTELADVCPALAGP